MYTMTRLSVAFVLALGLGFAATGASADEVPLSKSGKPLTAQQQRMGDCSRQSKGKTGDERRSFMSACLKGQVAAMPAPAATPAASKAEVIADADPAPLASTADASAEPAVASTTKTVSPARAAQNERMRACNAKARGDGLKGDERRSFMSGCLKKDSAIALN